MEPWYIEFKDRFDWEREALNKQGFSLQTDILENQKKIVFTGVVNVNNKDYKLDIKYPTGFPYFPPECFCQDKDFLNKKHILPNAGKLCLYVDWEDNRNKTGIDILERAKVWIEKTLTDSFSPSEEIDGPEPKQYSLFSGKHNGVLIAPESCYQPDWNGKEGNFTINIQVLQDELNERFLFKGLLSKIHCNKIDFSSESELDILKQNTREYSGKCFEVVTAPPYFEDQNELIEWLEQQGHRNVKTKCEQASVHLRDKALRNNPNVEIGALLGVKYKDEVGQKENYESRFLVVGLKSSKVVDRRPLHFPYVVFKSEEISKNKLFKRSPSLLPLSDQHVLVLGLGTIGSSVAVDLAKAGIGKLTLIDNDTVSVGNVIRQEPNIHYVGLSKKQSIELIVKSHNPFTKVQSFMEHWGNGVEEEIIREHLKDVDLIVCTVGHHHTEYYLNHLAYYYNIPIVFSYVGSGAWSGRAFRVIPGETGCYFCHQEQIAEDGELQLVEPDENQEVYDDGCATPAFIGSGIDTGIIANFTTRLSIQTLLSEEKDAYEQTENDHIFWISQGNGGNMKLVQKKIDKHPNCDHCNR